jgi:hypothetical protein
MEPFYCKKTAKINCAVERSKQWGERASEREGVRWKWIGRRAGTRIFRAPALWAWLIFLHGKFDIRSQFGELFMWLRTTLSLWYFWSGLLCYNGASMSFAESTQSELRIQKTSSVLKYPVAVYVAYTIHEIAFNAFWLSFCFSRAKFMLFHYTKLLILIWSKLNYK